MKLIRKLFNRKPMTIADVMDAKDIDDMIWHDYHDVQVNTNHVGWTFEINWIVTDMNEGFKAIAEGFKTKAEARDYAYSYEEKEKHRCYIYPVEKRIA